MTTRVVHCKRERYDVYIGRPSIWGNPDPAPPPRERTPEVTAAALARYETYLRSRPDLMARLPELRGKVLGCWCKPAGCHGDVLARLADARPPPEGQGRG